MSTEPERELRDLVAAREDLVHLRTAEKNRQQVTTHALVSAQIGARIAALDTDIAALNAAIDAGMSRDPRLLERRALMQSMPGVGPIISATLLAYLPELGEMDRRQIAALAGLAPYDQESGTQRGTRHIAGGRSRVRRAMYQAANASGHDPVLKARKPALCSRKPHKVALVALARYQLSMLTVMLRDGLCWDQTKVGQGTCLTQETPAIVP